MTSISSLVSTFAAAVSLLPPLCVSVALISASWLVVAWRGQRGALSSASHPGRSLVATLAPHLRARPRSANDGSALAAADGAEVAEGQRPRTGGRSTRSRGAPRAPSVSLALAAVDMQDLAGHERGGLEVEDSADHVLDLASPVARSH